MHRYIYIYIIYIFILICIVYDHMCRYFNVPLEKIKSSTQLHLLGTWGFPRWLNRRLGVFFSWNETGGLNLTGDKAFETPKGFRHPGSLGKFGNYSNLFLRVNLVICVVLGASVAVVYVPCNVESMLWMVPVTWNKVRGGCSMFIQWWLFWLQEQDTLPPITHGSQTWVYLQ